MMLKQISYETFFQRRFNVSLLFFNVVSTLKQRVECLTFDIIAQQAQRRCFNVETTLENSKLTLKRC